jgi:MoaA/NifB/PqqE/SkfB family radical SAM enzyme
MNFKNIKFDNFENIYVYGFGLAGKWFSDNSPKKIKAFIDTDEKKSGRVHNSISVIKIDEAKKNISKNDLIVVSVVDIQDVVPILKRNFPKNKWVALGFYLDGNDADGSLIKVQQNLTSHESVEDKNFINYSLYAVEKCHKAFINKDKFFLRSIDIVLSEKCSLKCKDCSNLMQFYINPKTFSNNQIVNEFAELTEKISHIFEVRLIGGEPFMNKEIYDIIDYFCNHEKITRCVIYTNGTIPLKPERLKKYRNSKLVFALTDYGSLSKNTDKVHDTLLDLKIATRRHVPENWTDSGRIEDFKRSTLEMKKLFEACCGKNLLTTMNGRLYRCPFAANAESLKGIPFDSKNSVRLNSSPEEISKYTRDIDYIPACNYCNGRSFDAKEIIPAIQTPNRKPIKYKIYN